MITGDEAPEPDLEASGEGCPSARGLVFLDKLTGEYFPARCKRNGCGYCVQGNARRRARAIALAAPERAILLTQVGNDWPTVQNRMNVFKYRLQRELGRSFDWVYHVEPNPEGTGHHSHAWERGAYLPQEAIARIADGVGMGGVAFINRIRNATKTSHYGLKGLGYGMKGVKAEESRVAYMKANGGRLTHQSRGFFVDSDGQSVGVREAERAASGAGQEPGRWLLMVNPSA